MLAPQVFSTTKPTSTFVKVCRNIWGLVLFYWMSAAVVFPFKIKFESFCMAHRKKMPY